MVKGVNTALAACESEPSLKHFIYTSSAGAVTLPRPDVDFTITAGTWNDESVRLAWDPNAEPGVASSALYPTKTHVYCASKTEAERAMWKYVDEHKPNFTVNSIVPNFNLGPAVAPGSPRPNSG